MTNKEAFIIINNIIYHNEKYDINTIDMAVKTIRKIIKERKEENVNKI